MAEHLQIQISGEQVGERLDVLLSAHTELTRSRIGSLIKDGCVLLNGAAPSKAGIKLRAGDSVEMTVPDAAPVETVAQDIPIEILYQDADLAVVYKPSGMVVHPAAGNPDA